MSNRVNLVSTKFVNVKENHETFGFRIYDEYAQAYENTWDSIPNDDLDFFVKVLRESSTDLVEEMLDYMHSHENGVCIDGEWYEWEQIENLF